MSTFLNLTGAGDYNLPALTGKRQFQSNKKSFPSYTLKDKTKLAWFPERYVNFVGQSSPPSTTYSPKTDRPYKNLKYSQVKDQRFHIPNHLS